MQQVFDGYSEQGKRAIEAYLNKLAFKWDGKMFTIRNATRRGNDVVMDMDEVGYLDQSGPVK